MSCRARQAARLQREEPGAVQAEAEAFQTVEVREAACAVQLEELDREKRRVSTKAKSGLFFWSCEEGGSRIRSCVYLKAEALVGAGAFLAAAHVDAQTLSRGKRVEARRRR